MDKEDPTPGMRCADYGELARGPTNDAEKYQLEARRDEIAEAMWDSYQALLQERGEMDE
jgi:hypothetical protein